MAITLDRTHELYGDEKTFLQPGFVTAAYERVDKIPRSDVLKMIGLYPKWQRGNLDYQELAALTWYLDHDSKHISHILTDKGKQRHLQQVAERYEMLKPEKLGQTWDRVRDIEEMIAILESGQSLPPIIVVKGSRYKDSPESSFIDGIHRGLAEMVYSLRFPDRPLKFPAFMGQKANIGERLIKKFI